MAVKEAGGAHDNRGTCGFRSQLPAAKGQPSALQRQHLQTLAAPSLLHNKLGMTAAGTPESTRLVYLISTVQSSL